MSKSKLPVVDTRLRSDIKLYSETRIATSSDVAFLLADEIQKADGAFVGILNLNTRGQPVSFDIASPEMMEEHFKEVMTNTVLSNAVSFAIISNLEEWEAARELSIRFGDAGKLLDHVLLDHYWIDETGCINSFLSKKWPLASGLLYEDRIDVEYGAVKEGERIHNNLRLVEERCFETDEEITRETATELLAEELTYRDRENTCVISLDEQGKPINCGYISIGTVTASLASQKEILKIPILSNASSIIIMHNHPSGLPQPSHEDLQATASLTDAANMVGIRLEDHIIVAGMTGASYSMKERGDLMRIEETYGQLTKLMDKVSENRNAEDRKDVEGKVKLPEFRQELLPEQRIHDCMKSREKSLVETAQYFIEM